MLVVGVGLDDDSSAMPSVEDGLEAEDEDTLPVLLVSVDDVGTVVLRAERFRVASFCVDEVVVDMIMRSICDARLSDESCRRSCLSGPVEVLIGGVI